MRRLGRIALVVGCLAGWTAAPAAALHIQVTGPTGGSVTTGAAVESAVVGDLLTFVVGFDAPTAIQGYDLSILWDAAELSFVSALELSGIGFTIAPAGANPAGERVAAIAFPSDPAVVASALFSVTFQVTSVVTDGAADFRAYLDAVANGSGVAPGGTGPIANPNGAAITVPESGLLGLFGLSLLALHTGRARTRTPHHRRIT